MGDVPPEGSGGGGGGRSPGIFPLARQTSIYSLTFDEFQNTMGGLGKDFGSMNMDEFLRNIWTAEEAQVMGMASSSFGGADGGISSGNLQRQGSLTLPRTLSQKTVDEVWRDLFKENGGSSKEGNVNVNGNGNGNCGPNLQQRQQTLGEMTLEEFLVRAGVVREETQQVGRPSNNGFYGELFNTNNNASLALGFGQPNRTNGLAVNHVTETNNAQLASPGIRGGVVGLGETMMNNGFVQGGGVQGGGVSMVGLGAGGVTIATASPANHPSSDGLGKSNGDNSSLSPVPYVFNGTLRGKRSGAVEKVVERRQRRMIKNRESAARSRARKQAYTMELEAEVAKLKEENQELQKKQAEIMELQKNQVLEMMNQQPGAKKRCLRRTQTGPW
ncbi:Basic-leucine zipper domain [Macleaya cordata]|uniref:Basic-leucine zipper domain n=1 Tax=Macleaya cordata TaxID=56857 RepID=A0A200QZE1_MACCD|nr:Basic-leucine zipper domain [Macleaya cordata]